MDIKISIIIPAYNAHKYIERCLLSLSVQDMPTNNYEAIVINDGSTDNTQSLLDVLCKQYSFVRYVSTPNSGLSASRNRGVKEATGKYLLFLDADDSIIPNCLKEIYKEMSGTQRKGGYHIDKNDEKIVSGKQFLIRENYPPMIPLYAYRRSFITENNLSFLSIGHEDEEFTPKAIYMAKRIKYYPLTFYNYFQNEESFMHTYKESNFYDMLTAMGSLNRFRLEHENDPKIISYFNDHIANRVIMIFKRSIRDGHSIQKELIQKIKEEGLYPLKPQRSSFYIRLFNYSPTLFERYYRFIKHK